MALWFSIFAMVPASVGDLPDCEVSDATEITWAQLFWRADEFEGKCVTLSGHLGSRELFEDRAAYYRYTQPAYANRPNRGWVGIYSENERDENWSRLTEAKVVGRLKNCGHETDRSAKEAAEANAREEAAGSDSITISFVGGYCHYRTDFALFDVNIMPGKPSSWSRAVGEQARADFGDIVRASGDLQPTPAIQSLIGRFETAIRNDDRAWLKENLNDYGAYDPAEKSHLADVLTGKAVDVLSSAGSSRATYFRAASSESWNELPSWFACYCRKRDCTDSWPIAAIDTALSAQHPYVCITIKQNPDDPARFGLQLPVYEYLPEVGK